MKLNGVTYRIAVLYRSETGVGLPEAEVFWIAEMRRRGNRLTNLTDGGGGPLGRKQSPETRKKISDANRGRKCSPEHCKKNGDAHRGQNTSKAVAAAAEVNRGKKRVFTAEWKERISAGRKGLKFSPEHIEKLRLTSTGRRHTEETKKKITGRPPKLRN